VDTGFDENKTELGVLVLSVALKMLADGNSLGLASQWEESLAHGEFRNIPS
jgi:hypothetical protein